MQLMINVQTVQEGVAENKETNIIAKLAIIIIIFIVLSFYKKKKFVNKVVIVVVCGDKFVNRVVSRWDSFKSKVVEAWSHPCDN